MGAAPGSHIYLYLDFLFGDGTSCDSCVSTHDTGLFLELYSSHAQANRKLGAQLITPLSRLHTFHIPNPPPCPASGDDMVKARVAGTRCAGGQASTAETIARQTASGSSHQQNAIVLSNVRGDARATCSNCSWVSRYSTGTCLTTTTHALHRMTWVASCVFLYPGIYLLCRSLMPTPRSPPLAGNSTLHRSDSTPTSPQLQATGADADTHRLSRRSRVGPKSDGIRRRPADTFMFGLVIMLANIPPVTSAGVIRCEG